MLLLSPIRSPWYFHGRLALFGPHYTASVNNPGRTPCSLGLTTICLLLNRTFFSLSSLLSAIHSVESSSSSLSNIMHCIQHLPVTIRTESDVRDAKDPITLGVEKRTRTSAASSKERTMRKTVLRWIQQGLFRTVSVFSAKSNL